MQDEDGNIVSEKEILKVAMDHLSEACSFLFELESLEGECLGFMADSVLKLAQVLYLDDSPLSASTDFQRWEEKKYQEYLKKRKLKLIR